MLGYATGGGRRWLVAVGRPFGAAEWRSRLPLASARRPRSTILLRLWTSPMPNDAHDTILEAVVLEGRVWAGLEYCRDWVGFYVRPSPPSPRRPPLLVDVDLFKVVL